MNWKFWQRRKPAPVAPVVSLPKPVKVIKAPPPVLLTKPDPDKMDPEVKAEWTRRLASGEYQQGEAALRTRRPHEKSQYCCLGVLCEMAVEKGAIPPAEKKHEDAHIYVYDGMTGVPSERVVQWAGLPSENPIILYKGEHKSLAELNDFGVPFPEIAKLIDEQL